VTLLEGEELKAKYYRALERAVYAGNPLAELWFSLKVRWYLREMKRVVFEFRENQRREKYLKIVPDESVSKGGQ